MYETVPDGNVPTHPPDFSRRIVSFIAETFCEVADLPPNGFTQTEYSLISGIFARRPFRMTFASERAFSKTVPIIIPSIPPSGWFETTTSGPVFGIFAKSSSSIS